jgi:hypothetical protein
LSEDELARLLEERAMELSKRLEEFRKKLKEGRVFTTRRAERVRKKILEYLEKAKR